MQESTPPLNPTATLRPFVFTVAHFTPPPPEPLLFFAKTPKSKNFGPRFTSLIAICEFTYCNK
jgi:hypothetical protein